MRIIAAATLLMASVLGPALSKDIYQSPDDEEYYRTLKQPDHPDTSCCGWGDAYWADDSEQCSPLDQKCGVVAIITDTRPDSRVYVSDSGNKTQISRPHIPVGTRIVVPKSKLRQRPIPTPDDHTIIFVSTSFGSPFVYCYEPQARM